MIKKIFLATTLAVAMSASYANPTTAPSASTSYNVNVANSIDNLAEKIRKYQEQNPQATDAQLNAYVDTLLQTEVSQEPVIMERSTPIYGLDGYAQGFMNAQEKKLYASNKAKAILCLANGKLAIKFTSERYAGRAHNNNADAFRHALWNFGMTKDVGADFAKKWSDAHEYGVPKPTSKAELAQYNLEQSMDLYNNSIGINLGKKHTGLMLPSKMADIVQEQVRTGKLKVISGKSLTWSNSAGEK